MSNQDWELTADSLNDFRASVDYQNGNLSDQDDFNKEVDLHFMNGIFWVTRPSKCPFYGLPGSFFHPEKNNQGKKKMTSWLKSIMISL
ncbi:hypothetical protein Dthio_PD1556 [Desulfonatronospira thiodismutans ASO3-1]|uniref:Uncharacterized protein n=1 Tax=Desulfonatronospira thiodismutans ASO3-1 TaxID=555779 RepID=D6SN79_9BACT|nr:hypothetical protein Dthio_PD1556 [Desulfonatronospira thiodismutans ASO3-1]